jgi:hypothetical protein
MHRKGNERKLPVVGGTREHIVFGVLKQLKREACTGTIALVEGLLPILRYSILYLNSFALLQISG